MRRLWDAIPSICVYLSQRTVFDNTNGTHNEFFCHMKLTCSEWKLHPAMDTFVVQSSMLCFPSNLEAQAVTVVPRHPILFWFLLLHLAGGDL